MSKSITVPTAESKDIKDVTSSVADIAELALSLEITNNDEYEFATSQMTAIRDAEKALEARRVSITGPMNQALKATNALFKPPAEFLDRAKRALGIRMLDYTRTLQAKQAAAAAEAQRLRNAEIEAANLKLRQAQEEANSRISAATTEEEIEAAAQLTAEAQAQLQAAEISMPTGVVAAAPAKGGHATRKRIVTDLDSLPLLLAHAASELRQSKPGEPLWEAWVGIIEINHARLAKLIEARGTSVPGVSTRVEETIAARGSS